MSCTCAYCRGVSVSTPIDTINRPGLNALIYRIGDYASFFETMKARLSSRDFRLPSGTIPLNGLKTRDASDPAIALLDVWAVVSDVLTFYQERIANEGYLPTATESRSISELAALVGYALRPGVAASTFVAYQVDGRDDAIIPAGSKVQSIPGPGELPQTFETSTDLTGPAAFSNLAARTARPQILAPGKTNIYVAGVANNLNPDDRVLVVASPPVAGRIATVQVEANEGRTLIALAAPPPPPARPSPVTLEDLVAPLSKAPAAHPASPLELSRRPDQVFTAALDTAPKLVSAFHPEAGGQLYTALENAPVVPPVTSELHAFRVKAGLFGANAPLKQVTDATGIVTGTQEWPLAGALSITMVFSFVEFTTGAPSEGGGSDFRVFQKNVTGSISRTNSVLALLVKIARGDRTASKTISGSQQAGAGLGFPTDTQHIGPWELNIGTDTDGNTTFEFSQLKRSYKMSGQAVGDLITVTADDKETISAPLGQKAASDSGDRHLTLSSNLKIDQVEKTLVLVTFTLTITDDSALEPPAESTAIVNLDATYDNIVPGSYALVVRANPDSAGTETVLPAVVTASKQVSLAQYGITGRVTQLTLRDPDPTRLFAWFDPAKERTLAAARTTTVFARSEQLTLAPEPIPDDISGDTLELADLHEGLQPGRWVIVKGERTDVAGASGVVSGELMMVAGVEQNVQQDSATPGAKRPGETLHSFLHLAGSLAYSYKRDTVALSGNVVRATHGETRNEVLGSGDSSKAMQQFTLRQGPLTYVSAPTPSGAASTLKIFVNGIQWQEVDTLDAAGPSDRFFVTRTGDKNQVIVMFGDGIHGMRLPTGAENVTATYRVGIGAAANVTPGKISLLTTKPLGARTVVNPLPASGGADPESSESGRSNTPTATIALDRLVSIQDYADFARTFAGIGKAAAVQRTGSQRQGVFVTVAGAGGALLDPNSELLQNLNDALHRFGDPHLQVTIGVCELLFLVIVAKVKLLPNYLWTSVGPLVQAALLDAFSFDRRSLGEPVYLSAVAATVQQVAGVSFVDIDTLETIAAQDVATDTALQAKFAELAATRAPKARIVPRPTQLVFLNPATPDTLLLTENPS
jgi:predicted phage baseplate assembly protein